MSEETATVGSALEADHRAIDAEFEAFAAGLAEGRVEADRYAAGARGLRHHIWVEEEYHFPPLRAGGLMGPIMVMLREHGELWDLLDTLDAQVAESAGAEPIRETWARILGVLEAHNMKEERILYPSGDGLLDEDASATVLEALASGERPDEWASEMSGRG